MHDPNENRAGYQKTKVGWLPEHWDCRVAQEICQRVTVGIVIEPSQYYRETGVPAFRGANVGEGHLTNAKWIHISSEGHDKNRKSAVKTGDVLIVRSGYPGTACVVPQCCDNFNCIDLVILSPISDILEPSFLCSLVNSALGRIQITKRQGGLAQKHINVNECKTLVVPLPPLPEQQKIVEILSTWDDAIEQTGALIESKRQQKKALMQQLLSGHRRLPEFTEPLITERLKAHIVERHRRCKTRTDLPILSVTNDRGFVSQDEQFGRRVASTDVSNYKVVKEGEFAYNPSRVNVGSLDMLRNIEAGLLSPMYIVFSVKETALEATYLRHFCDTYSFAEQVRHLTQGSVRDSLSFEGLAAIKCLIPSLREQRAIADVLDTADKEIASLVAKLEALRQQKKGLMQRLLTGQVRVKTA